MAKVIAAAAAAHMMLHLADDIWMIVWCMFALWLFQLKNWVANDGITIRRAATRQHSNISKYVWYIYLYFDSSFSCAVKLKKGGECVVRVVNQNKKTLRKTSSLLFFFFSFRLRRRDTDDVYFEKCLMLHDIGSKVYEVGACAVTSRSNLLDGINLDLLTCFY